MLRFSGRLLQAAAPGKDRTPYQVLGVAANATDAQVKDKFKEMARRHHPDMPTGNAKKFREVTAAYQLIKKERADAERLRTTGSAEDPKMAQYNYRKPTPDDSEDAKTTFRGATPAGNLYSAKDFWWTTDVIEFVSTLLCLGIAGFYSIHRWFIRFDTARSNKYGKLAELEKIQASPLVKREDVEVKSWRKDMLENKIADKYSTLKDFLITNDPDFAFDRTLTAARIAGDLMDDSIIEKRCPVVLHINTQGGLGVYEQTLPDHTKDVLERRWRHVDQGPATALALQAVGAVATNNPSGFRLSVIEYKSKEDKFPTCSVAIFNHKYTSTSSPSQRIVITGEDEFQPRLLRQRMAELANGTLKDSDLLQGEMLVTKDRPTVDMFKGVDRTHMRHQF